jgi:hypothetical protein
MFAGLAMPRSYARRCEIHRRFIGDSSAWVRLRAGCAAQRRFHLPFPWACAPGGRGSLVAVYRLRPSLWCLPDPGRPERGQPAGRRADRSQHHSRARRNKEYLDELSRLVEDYLRELPEMLDCVLSRTLWDRRYFATAPQRRWSSFARRPNAIALSVTRTCTLNSA